MYLFIVTLHCHFLAATSKMQLKHAGHLPSPYATPSQLYVLYITCCTYEQNDSHYERQICLASEERENRVKFKRVFWGFFSNTLQTNRSQKKLMSVTHCQDLRQTLLRIPNRKRSWLQRPFLAYALCVRNLRTSVRNRQKWIVIEATVT